MELTLKECIQKLLHEERFMPALCKVKSVTGNEVELQVLSGGENIKDARLKVSKDSVKGMKITPAVNSEVLVLFAEKGNITFIVGYSDIKDVDFDISGKFKMANDAQNLKDILHDILQAMINLKVATSYGPSTAVINALDFVALNQRLNLLFS